MLIRQWEPLRIALTDFGIASVAEATQHFTTTTRTLRYAASEVADRGDWEGGEFADLYLAPFYFRYPDMRHTYLIELKYFKRYEDTPERRAEAWTETRQQLGVRETLGAARLHRLALVYSGWELVVREEVV